MCPQDARERGIGEGDLVRAESRRGAIQAPARLSGTRPGVVFAPFRYGYFDNPGRQRPKRSTHRGQGGDPAGIMLVFRVTI